MKDPKDPKAHMETDIQNIFMNLDPWTRFWIYYGSLTIAGTLTVALTLTLTQKDPPK